MSYFTKYSLEEPTDQQIIEDLRIKYEGAEIALNCYGGTRQSCKWYDHASDLKQFSLNYPEHLFILSGEGEENNDIWKLYVKNGKSKKSMAKIVFDEFKESELQ